MTLCDTGPLVAIISSKDPYHSICVQTVQKLPKEPLLTTWPCVTEAMHLLHPAGGYLAQATLWGWLCKGQLVLHELTTKDMVRMAELMNQYRDRPMALADASLVAVAEATKQRRIFALDADFRIYRLGDGTAFEVVP